MGWTQYTSGGSAALVLVLVAVVRFTPRRGRRADVTISPTVLGYLVGGSRRAVVTALAMLHVQGAVRAAKRGTAKRADGRFSSDDRLLSATYAALYQTNGPSGIEDRPQFERAVREVRKDLVAARLTVPAGRMVVSRWAVLVVVPLLGSQLHHSHDTVGVVLCVVLFVLAMVLVPIDRRTRAGRALTARLRREHPAAPENSENSDADAVGYAVAAHGKRALLQIMPRFAQDAGLLDGGVAAKFTGDSGIGPDRDAMSGYW